MIFLPVILLSISFLGSRLFGFTLTVNDQVLLPIISTTLCYFLIRTEMKFYQQVWWRAILKGAALYFCFFLTLQLYRLILFFTVLWTV
jgi:hypothetical protein